MNIYPKSRRSPIGVLALLALLGLGLAHRAAEAQSEASPTPACTSALKVGRLIDPDRGVV
ncbi:MAG: hypothetical protein RL597_1501, partial [Pseudomonadota bacterium]